MITEDVLDILRVLGDYTDEEIEKYSPISQINISLIDESVIDEKDYSNVVYYLAAKTNYEICLMRLGDGITSFTAGDIKFSQNQDLNRAKELYEMTCSNVAGYLSDNGFVFMEV